MARHHSSSMFRTPPPAAPARLGVPEQGRGARGRPVRRGGEGGPIRQSSGAGGPIRCPSGAAPPPPFHQFSPASPLPKAYPELVPALAVLSSGSPGPGRSGHSAALEPSPSSSPLTEWAPWGSGSTSLGESHCPGNVQRSVRGWDAPLQEEVGWAVVPAGPERLQSCYPASPVPPGPALGGAGKEECSSV